MKVLLAGVVHAKGISKEGRPFDFAKIVALQPFAASMSPKFNSQGAGYESVPLDLDPECLPAFTGLRYPGLYDVEFDSRLTRRGIEQIAIGCKPVAAEKPGPADKAS